jgi:circadian clock protein KaiB
MKAEPTTRERYAGDRGPSGPVRNRLVLRLYIAGAAPNSMLAEANLRALLGGMRPTEYELEIVDCILEPLRALQDGVFVTPMLLKLSPEPAASIVGSLRDVARVSLALGLVANGGGGDE